MTIKFLLNFGHFNFEIIWGKLFRKISKYIYKMPKNEIDYSNTIIYKIFCKDKSISDMYVGHTTSFIKRKYQHKLCCNNLNNKLKIYDTIRANGGWDNWEMIQIANYNCKNSEEARIKEQEHYEELEPTLNISPPYSDMLKSYCYDCNLQCSSLHSYNIISTHTHTHTHIYIYMLQRCH
jgi:hypothetical protein